MSALRCHPGQRLSLIFSSFSSLQDTQIHLRCFQVPHVISTVDQLQIDHSRKVSCHAFEDAFHLPMHTAAQIELRTACMILLHRDGVLLQH